MYKNAKPGNAESLARKSSLVTMKHPLDRGKKKQNEKNDKLMRGDTQKRRRRNKNKSSENQTDNQTGNQSRFSRQLLNVSFVSKAFRDVTSHSRVKLIHALWVTLEKHEKKEVSKLIVQSDVEEGNSAYGYIEKG